MYYSSNLSIVSNRKITHINHLHNRFLSHLFSLISTHSLIFNTPSHIPKALSPHFHFVSPSPTRNLTTLSPPFPHTQGEKRTSTYSNTQIPQKDTQTYSYLSTQIPSLFLSSHPKPHSKRAVNCANSSGKSPLNFALSSTGRAFNFKSFPSVVFKDLNSPSTIPSHLYCYSPVSSLRIPHFSTHSLLNLPHQIAKGLHTEAPVSSSAINLNKSDLQSEASADRSALSAYTSPPSMPPADLSFASESASSSSKTPIAEMAQNKKKAIHRLDYTGPQYSVEQVYLEFDLDGDNTKVHTEIEVTSTESKPQDIVLNGEEMTLHSVSINDNVLSNNTDYEVSDESLKIYSANIPTEKFTLKTDVSISPNNNLKLLGLYSSKGMFCTQCEAQGFRRITYFWDRPDVMTKFTVKISANKASYPVLLSNGNKIKHTEDGDTHSVVFEDPFPKPSYLFALVAGDLGHIASTFTTMSGKNVNLKIFSEHRNIDKLDWSMESLKQAMKWDEDTFGLEYDLDEFTVVAVEDFNMGAMENKGLNIFNTALVLAKESMTSDIRYSKIRNTVAHEYFHNWTGNRVTCRDWFQLTLKEGLTVYRHQTFSYTVGNASVNRIDDIIFLRSHQFAEDSGSMAHPIRPDTYMSIENFYTVTVYEKGAEVVRMYETILGKEGFRKGMDLYFKRFDGSAVTCDDFKIAMADANNVDLTQFGLWYNQKGTPTLSVTEEVYDKEKSVYKISFKQKLPHDLPDGKTALVIPIKFGLIGKETHTQLIDSTVLMMNETEQTFTFENIQEKPIPSILRDLSAPVKLDHSYSYEDSLIIASYDTDAFNKWEVTNKLVTNEIYTAMKKFQNDEENVEVNPQFIETFKTIIQSPIDSSLKALMVSIPGYRELTADLSSIDLDSLIKANKFVVKSIADAHQDIILQIYNDTQKFAHENENYFSKDTKAIGNRELANTLLTTYISKMPADISENICWKHFNEAKCMSDKLGGFIALSHCSSELYDKATSSFYEFAKDEPLLLDTWFQLQSFTTRSDTLERVKSLLEHKDFNIKNPNRMRSLLAAFTYNTEVFHNKDGTGYDFIFEGIKKVDSFNSIMSSGLSKSFTSFKKYDSQRQELMKETLKKIMLLENLSTEVLEVVSKSLGE